MKPFRNNLLPEFLLTCTNCIMYLFQFINGRFRFPRIIKVWFCGHSLSMLAGSNPAGGINLLKTKCRLLYLKTQFLPHSKHFSSYKGRQASWKCRIEWFFSSILWIILRDTCNGFFPNALRKKKKKSEIKKIAKKTTSTNERAKWPPCPVMI
jgi:hypothetical protein